MFDGDPRHNELPIVVKTDTIGAIFKAKHALMGIPTSHVDTQYNFMEESIEECTIKIESFRSL
jgi:hypothetical protein